MKLINLLIRELDNCSVGGDFRDSRHAEICRNCQFGRFSLEINFKRARSSNYGIPRLVQVKMEILYANIGDLLTLELFNTIVCGFNFPVWWRRKLKLTTSSTFTKTSHLISVQKPLIFHRRVTFLALACTDNFSLEN